MTLNINTLSRFDWIPLPHEGCHGVMVRVLPKYHDVALAMLHFEPGGTIHEHPADIDIDVICLEGRGKTSVGIEEATLSAGQYVHWPAGRPHRLWAEDSSMVTLMVEHQPSSPSRKSKNMV